jgi:hypothetical protein
MLFMRVEFYRHEVVDIHCQAFGVFGNLSGNSEVEQWAIVDANALPEFEYVSIALSNIASQTCFRTSVIDMGSCRPLVALLQCVSVLICICEG